MIFLSPSIWDWLLAWALAVETGQQWGWPASHRACRRSLILQMVFWAIMPLSGHHPGVSRGLMQSSCGATAFLWCMQAPVQAGSTGKDQAGLWPSTSNAWQYFREQQGSRQKPLESPCRCSSGAAVLLWALGVWGIPSPGQWRATRWRQFQ